MRARTIMVVDDEPQIRSLVRALLSGKGFDLVEASDGVEALEICTSRPKPIDVLITDIVMPRMDGVALADEVSARYPEVRVMYMSGKCDAAAVEERVQKRRFTFLRKPFQIGELREKVAELAGCLAC